MLASYISGTIILDGVSNGQLAEQGNVKIFKDASGKVSYVMANGKSAEKAENYNMMSTPKGGQYGRADSTKDAVKCGVFHYFSTSFIGKDRNVKITKCVTS